jgi:hypothetical protein
MTMTSTCKPVLLALAVLCGMATGACSSTWVVVPSPSSQYTAADTLYGVHRDGEVRVTFRHDTVMRVDTVVRVDTAWVRGARQRVRVDTVLRVDTVRMPAPRRVARVDTVMRVDTVRIPARTIVRVDTVRVPGRPVVRVDTVMRVDTVRVPGRPVVRVDTVMRVDTVRVPVNTTVVRSDTVLRIDTVRVVVTDTVIHTVTTPGRRMLFVPPGHYPPAGQCRIWIHDRPPGQQARAAACDALGDVPAGAFILFGGEAWDFDYDWLGEAERQPGTVPPQIIALKPRR